MTPIKARHNRGGPGFLFSMSLPRETLSLVGTDPFLNRLRQLGMRGLMSQGILWPSLALISGCEPLELPMPMNIGQ